MCRACELREQIGELQNKINIHKKLFELKAQEMEGLFADEDSVGALACREQAMERFRKIGDCFLQVNVLKKSLTEFIEKMEEENTQPHGDGLSIFRVN